MKSYLLVLIALLWLSSCVDFNETSKTTNTNAQKQTDSVQTKSDRQFLVVELKKLQSVFATGNKERIADLFEFPVTTQTLSVYPDDSAFNSKLQQTGDRITREMFIQFYSEIANRLWIDETKAAIGGLSIDKLLQQDTLRYAAPNKNEPCFFFCEFSIDSQVTLIVGTDSNEDFVSKSTSEYVPAENSSEVCEHALSWIFRFDGKRLRLEQVVAAG